MMCRGQVITAGMGDVIDINIGTVIAAMNVCRIKNQERCLEKVIKLFRECQKNRKSEDET